MKLATRLGARPPARVLVIQTAYIGDTVFTSALVRAISRRFPGAEVDVCVAPRARVIRDGGGIPRRLRGLAPGAAGLCGGLTLAQVPTVGVRTGDTDARERRRLLTHPPDILITTPESLYLMLTSSARETLRSVRTVIVDEIHAIAATKRGAHLMLSLERLEALMQGVRTGAVDGIMFPFAVESGIKGTDQKQKLTITKVELNVPADDSMFKMPAAAPKADAPKTDPPKN